MIKLRLKRYGKKFEVSYRIVAMKSSTRRDGRPLEELGFYNPRTDEVRLDVEGIVKRLREGAQPTETVRHLLKKQNVFAQVSPLATGESVQSQVMVESVQPQVISEQVQPQATDASVQSQVMSEQVQPQAISE
jgi:small subunit ribosomal protein S16